MPSAPPSRIQIEDLGRRSTAAATRSSGRSATASRSGRRLPRRPRGARAPRSGQAAGRAPLARGADARHRQRPLDGRVRGRRARPLGVHRRGLGRPLRLLARRAPAQGRGRPGRPRERARRGRGAPRSRGRDRRGGARDRRQGPLRGDDARSPSSAVDVDPELARFGAWYELFPRSWGGFEGVEKALPELAELGFDVVYLPPIHPIGRTTARAATTRSTAKAGDPGSPWAIGAEEGGHDAIHPELGTLEDFDRLVGARARARARDRARLRDPVLARPPLADGAPGVVPPPARRHDQVRREPAQALPGHRTTSTSTREDWRGSGRRCATSSLHWVEHGVRVFRVDNPHTKPLPFWEWLIARGARAAPRRRSSSPRRSRGRDDGGAREGRLHQSYTYFTWKNTKRELIEYVTRADALDAARVLPAELLRQHAGHPPRVPAARRPAGVRGAARARGDALADATASTPATSTSRTCRSREGSEEYLDSEKYEVEGADARRAAAAARRAG